MKYTAKLKYNIDLLLKQKSYFELTDKRAKCKNVRNLTILERVKRHLRDHLLKFKAKSP